MSAVRVASREHERRRRVARSRRRWALLTAIAAAIGGAIVGAIVGSGGSGERGPSSGDAASREPNSAPADSEQGSAAPACPPEVAAHPRRLVGQMLIVRMEDTATADLRRRVGDWEIGGVILFPSPGAAPDRLADQIAALRGAAERDGAPAPLVAIDQEGGEVRRLPRLPPRRSPPEIAAAGREVARAQGSATAEALASLGIDVDLAPVLDVPATPDSFIASRSLGADPRRVADLGVAFASGLRARGVAATAKHFPGLGGATANTDLGTSVVEAMPGRLERGLIPFRAAVDAGIGLIMVSNATYPTIDPARPASQSPRVLAMLRRGLGFDGVAITDDLGAGALAGAGLSEGEAALGAARAGADLLLLALSDGREAAQALRRALRRGQLDRRALLASCARVSVLRRSLAADAG